MPKGHAVVILIFIMIFENKIRPSIISELQYCMNFFQIAVASYLHQLLLISSQIGSDLLSTYSKLHLNFLLSSPQKFCFVLLKI